MSVLRVRPAGSADRPALRELFLRERRRTFTWNDPARYALADFDAETRGEAVRVADLDDRLAGFVAVWEPDSFVHHLYVDSGLRGRGVGTALLDAALASIRRPARLKCLVRNAAAVRFYRSRGWKKAGSGSDAEGDFHLMELA